MTACFINPPFKPKFGKFSRESRSPAITKSGALYYPLWLIYAAAYLKKNRGEILFVDAPAKQMSDTDVLNLLEREEIKNDALFILDTSTPSIESDIKFAELLKNKYTQSFIVLVGTHPTVCFEEILTQSNSIDAIALHEFDNIVKELYFALQQSKQSWKQIKGLAYKENGKIKCNPSMDYLNNLDEIPFASEFINLYLNVKDYFFAAATYPSIQIFTGRGCPFHCNFCVYPQTMHGHIFRTRTPRNVVDEFEYIANNFPKVKEVVIEDDTFTVNKRRILEICYLLIKKQINKKLKWLCNARVDLDYDTMLMMKEAGCRLIIPGFESGSQIILDNISKGIKISQIHEYVRNAKKAGLLIHACYMIGNRGESRRTMAETLKLALALDTDTAQFLPLIPYPGTEAYKWASRNGYITKNYSDYCKSNGSHNTVLNLPHLSAWEMVEFCNYARKKYYLRWSYICRRILMGLHNFDDLKRSLKAFGTFRKYLFK